MKRMGILVVIVAAGVVGLASSVRSQPNPSIGKFMRQKLDHSQKVLEGITLEDFSMIERNSLALAALSQAASWQVLKTPEYVTYSAEFLQLANSLTRAAREKNIDGATLAYVQLTLNCVNCHKHVRATRMAGNDSSILR